MVNSDIPLKLSSPLATYFEYEHFVNNEDMIERQYCYNIYWNYFFLLKNNNMTDNINKFDPLYII